MSSTVLPGGAPVTMAGSIVQSGSLVTAAVHVSGWVCFDDLTTITLSGSMKANTLSLTSIPFNGQVITLAATVTNNSLAGTYTAAGGCTNADQGKITGTLLPSLTGLANGILTPNGGPSTSFNAQLTQGHASPQGSFSLNGPVTFSGSCFSSGTITSGAFPSPSFVLGASVAVDVATDNGTLTFTGTTDMVSGRITGTYNVIGGTCDQIGTATLVPSFKGVWDY